MARYHGGLATLLLVLRKHVRIAPLKAPFLYGLATLAILAFSSTTTVLLNSDIGTAYLPGDLDPDVMKISPNLTTIYATNATWRLNHGTTWLRKPVTLPIFGQYSEKPELIEGVLDTGNTLRALVPYTYQPSRLSLSSMTAIATVLDTRVSCQAPLLKNVNISFSTSGPSMIQLDTYVEPSKLVPGLLNRTLRADGPADAPTDIQWDAPIRVSCLVSVSSPAMQYVAPGYQQPWRSSVCQLPNGWNAVTGAYEYMGGLKSEFQNKPIDPDDPAMYELWQSWKWGNAFLILNATTGTPENVAILASSAQATGMNPFPNSTTRKEWTDLRFDNLTLSTSVCYTSFMSADLPICMDADEMGIENSPVFSPTLNRWDFLNTRRNLGQPGLRGEKNTFYSRGQKRLSCQQPTWTANSARGLAPVEPYMRNAINMWNYQYGMEVQTASRMVGGNGNVLATHNGSISALMLQPEESNIVSPAGVTFILPDAMISDFFQDLVTTGGGVAFALQSLFYAMVGTEFYSSLVLFDNKDPNGVRRILFPVNAPVRAKGFLAVLVITLFSLVTVSLLVFQFLRTCRYTMLGNSSWKTLSQTVSPTTADALAAAEVMDDDQVEAMLKGQGKAHILVSLDPSERGRPPTVIERGTARTTSFFGEHHDQAVR